MIEIQGRPKSAPPSAERDVRNTIARRRSHMALSISDVAAWAGVTRDELQAFERHEGDLPRNVVARLVARFDLRGNGARPQ